MEGKRGDSVPGRGTIVNGGNLDVMVSTKFMPNWVDLQTDSFMNDNGTFTLRAGQALQIPFLVHTTELDAGTQSSALVFDITDADYPDCFFRQDLGIPFSVRVTCGDASRVTDANGVCVCSPSSVEISGNCVEIVILVIAVVLPIVALALLLIYVYAIIRTRNTGGDSIWEVDPSELKFDCPPKVIGQGSFGRVLKAEFRYVCGPRDLSRTF